MRYASTNRAAEHAHESKRHGEVTRDSNFGLVSVSDVFLLEACFLGAAGDDDERIPDRFLRVASLASFLTGILMARKNRKAAWLKPFEEVMNKVETESERCM